MRLAFVGTIVLLFPLSAVTDAVAQRIELPVRFEELERIAARDSNDAVAHYNLGLGHWSRGDYGAAEGAFREAIALDARLARAYLALAYVPFARDERLWNDWPEVPPEWDERMREADRLYERAFMIDPVVELKIVGAVVPRRSVLWQHSPVLADFYEHWLQAFDDFRDARYEDAYFRFNRFIQDRGGRKRLESVPTSFIWFTALAAAHLKRYDDAIELTEYLLAEALGRKSEGELTYLPLQENGYRYLLAYLHQQAGGYDVAISLYETALERDFGLYMAHVRLAEIHEARRDVAAALRERRLAVEASPDDATLVLDLGIAQAKAGRIADAKTTFTRMAGIQPRDPRPHYFLGLLHQVDGAHDQARRALELFLDLAPQRFAPQIQDARQRLATL
jgi:tetratricopeptide (TPR) repeat protein